MGETVGFGAGKEQIMNERISRQKQKSIKKKRKKLQMAGKGCTFKCDAKDDTLLKTDWIG